MRKTNIFAHRGLWERNNEKNTMNALTSALEDGYSIETDIRDYEGDLCISHDPPKAESRGRHLDELLTYYKKIGAVGTIALNIKADGLQHLVAEKLKKHGISKYFLFDMSIPDHLQYKKMKLKEYIRVSEYENYGELAKTSEGIWYDYEKCTSSNILDASRLLRNNQKLNFVSPELHGDKVNRTWVWSIIREQGYQRLENFELCTDHPDEAYSYFNN